MYDKILSVLSAENPVHKLFCQRFFCFPGNLISLRLPCRHQKKVMIQHSGKTQSKLLLSAVHISQLTGSSHKKAHHILIEIFHKRLYRLVGFILSCRVKKRHHQHIGFPVVHAVSHISGGDLRQSQPDLLLLIPVVKNLATELCIFPGKKRLQKASFVSKIIIEGTNIL